MKILIAGCGKVGRTLAERLSEEGNQITIIDTRQDLVNEVSNKFDVYGVVGNGAIYSVQIEAGIKQADLFIAVTGSDELNLLCCLIAKKGGDCQTIARVRNPEYSREISFIKEELGLALVINPEREAAADISKVLRFPSAIKIESFGKGRVELLKFRIPEDSILHGMSAEQIVNKLHCDVLICTVERGEEVYIPGGDFELMESDIISIVAKHKAAVQFFRKIRILTDKVKTVMIVGGGVIAQYLSEMLISMGIRVKLIEKNKERCDVLSELLQKATIIYGDGTDQNILLEEGIEQTEGFVTLTDMDEENILLSLFAKSISKAKIVTKVNQFAFLKMVNEFCLDTTICPRNVTAESILRYVRAMKNTLGNNVETMYRIIEEKAEALEFIIKNGKENVSLVGIPLEKMKIRDNILIASISRNGEIITPRGKDELRVGDAVLVVTTRKGLQDIIDIIQK